MFTGLIEDIGVIKKCTEKGHDLSFVVHTNLDMTQEKIGASIACSGCCLTVTNKGEDWFSVDVSTETLNKTHIADWAIDTPVNLERSLKIGDELGGHLVAGHVDCIAKIEAMEESGDCRSLTISLPADVMRYVAPKGSVTLDGISLTVNDVFENAFSVMIIPHTWTNTTLQYKKAGDSLNFEADMLARYVERMIKPHAQNPNKPHD